jgi:hypothetical protein
LLLLLLIIPIIQLALANSRVLLLPLATISLILLSLPATILLGFPVSICCILTTIIILTFHRTSGRSVLHVDKGKPHRLLVAGPSKTGLLQAV